ncbi:MAG: hypothetical protein P4L56_28370 [Candidatus Sulfopaludibacter sp.]|nr:hypothetical protein [Candidatus Sulfopaludibacter sp.]
MRTVFQLASVLACAFSMNAQITATLKRFPARSSEVAIRNNSTVNLTAFAIRMDPVAQGAADRAPFVFCTDTAVDTDRLGVWGPLPLPPNQEYAVPVTGSLRAGHPVDLFEPPIVTAAIFADGTTAGDAALLARLMLRRSNMLQAVELVRGILSDAVRRNVPRGQFIAQFQMMADSLDHWYLPPEQQVGRTLYQSITEKLINMSQLQAGAPFPPARFVEQEIAELNRRRSTLLESRPRLMDAAVMRQ